MNNEPEHIAPIELLTKYLAGETTEKEAREVMDWRDSSPENLKEFKSLAKLWNYTGSPVLQEAIDLDAEWQKMDNVIGPVKTRTIKFGRILAVAASIAALAILSVIGYRQIQLETFKTGVAETKEIKLPDGSSINLNANTIIAYNKDFGSKNRQLKLKGEAYFDVSADKNLPFVVSAGETKIQVVGTQFNVKAYKKLNEVKVTVSEGTVKLFDAKIPEKNTLINAGETGSFKRHTKAIEKIPETDLNDIAWKTKIIRFENTSLEEAARVLSNTYHIDIEVHDNVKPCILNVDFDHEGLINIMEVIKSTLDIKIKVEEDKLILSGEGC